MKREHKSPEILAINPAGTIPFITVDGEPLFESAAILRYIAVKFPSCNSFYPGGPEQRAMIDAGLDFNGTSLRKASMDTFVGIVFPRIFGNEPSDEAKAAATEAEVKLAGVYAMMDKAMTLRNH